MKGKKLKKRVSTTGRKKSVKKAGSKKKSVRKKSVKRPAPKKAARKTKKTSLSAAKKASKKSVKGGRKPRASSSPSRKKKREHENLTEEEISLLSQSETKDTPPTDRRRRKRSSSDESEERNSVTDTTLDRTPMKIYLNQIENIPLLTPEQEIDIARDIQSDGPKSEPAREKMIRSNLRLVISIAKRYSNMGLAFSDLVEEGNIGLMRAVEKFNPDRGYRFSTYASWWIKQAIMRALSNQGKTIRIPVYMYDIISKWRRVRDGLMQKLTRAPTRKEIAAIMEVPVQKIKEIENIAGRPSSLNAPVSLDGTAELIDLIEDDSSHAPDANIAEALKSERIRGLLEMLDEREKRILVLRFGLLDDETRTLEEVAQEFDITRERVRQIEAASLKKIRAYLVENKDRFENYLH